MKLKQEITRRWWRKSLALAGLVVVAAAIAGAIGYRAMEIQTTSTNFDDVVIKNSLNMSAKRIQNVGAATSDTDAMTPTNAFKVYNIKAYGAVIDGATDDGAAWRAALAAASATGGIVYHPGGVSIVGRDGTHIYCLNVPSNVTILGIRGQSIIRAASGMPNSPVNVLNLNGVHRVSIKDVVIDGNWQNAVGYVSDLSDNVSLPQATINVVDASFFPTAGGAFTVMPRGDAQAYITCTGKTSTTLTGCSGGTGKLFAGMTIGYIDAPAGINHTTQSTAVTTIASGSNGATLPQATINVASTTGFDPAGGNIWISTSQGYQLVACTGASGTTLTGCTGGTGTLSTGGETFANAATNGRNDGIGMTSSTDIEIRGVDVQRIYGDCIAMGGGLIPTSNVHISHVSCNIASRNGITFASATTNVRIEDYDAYSVSAQAIDSEPVAWPVRDIVIRDSHVRGWWNSVTHKSAPLSLAGPSSGSQIVSADASNWRITGTTFEGAVYIANASDVLFDGNRVVQNYALDDTTPIFISGWTRDVTVAHNYVYTRSATSGNEGQQDCCGILATSYIYAGGAIATSTNLHITDNDVHVRNGRYGIVLIGVGQNVGNTSGTMTSTGTTVVGGITYETATNSGAAWTTDQWIGAIVTMGGVRATVLANTATVLTLNHVHSVNTSNYAWFVPDTGDPAATPTAGAYKITFPTGTAEVTGNKVDGINDGYTKGKYCYVVGAGITNAVTTRVRVHHNTARDCDTYAYMMHSNNTNFMPYVEFSDNYAYDDQATPTTTTVVGFNNPLKVTKFVLGGNQIGEGVTNLYSGISAGTWLVRDGVMPSWAGFGSPESAVTAPIGSTYQRLDGTGITASYVKGSGTGDTGWLPAGGAVTTAGSNLSLTGQTLDVSANPTFTSVTTTTQISGGWNCSGTAPASVNHGSLGTGSTNCRGTITGIGANTSVVLTFGGSLFASRSICSVWPLDASVAPEVVTITASATAPTFNCLNSTTGIAANCDDLAYDCRGQ